MKLNKESLVTPEMLKEHLYYDTETGWVCWAIPTAQRVDIGDLAGCLSGAGYLTVDFLGHKFLLHRVIWALEKGVWPVGHIDHINRNKTDNRITNLRDVSRYENMHNMSSHRDAKSLYKGVSWHKRAKKWTANITRYGKTHYLGLFESEEDANKAYENFNGEPNENTI